MLATLNLQLSPVELLDDTNVAPVPPVSGDADEIVSGFANLLRLRVDAPLTAEDSGGEQLPLGGNGLPTIVGLEATSIEDGPDLPPMLQLDPGLIEPAANPAPLVEGEPDLQAESTDLRLESPVLYPAPNADTGAIRQPPIMGNVATPLTFSPVPTENSERLDMAARAVQNTAIDPRWKQDERPGGGRATPVVTAAADGLVARAQKLAREVATPSQASLGLRQRGQARESAIRATPVVLNNAVADAESATLQPTLAGRPELAPLRPADARAEPVFDVLQARVVPPQTLQGQISPQPALPTLSMAPSSTASADLTYSAVAQQGTDLIGTSVRDPAWRDQIGDRVVMMASNQLRHAEIRLTPAELGPLRIQVAIDDGAANVTFHAQHAVTRDVLEQAIPRLREMLAENGLSLGQADVSDRGVGEGGHDRDSDNGTANPLSDDGSDAAKDSGRDASRRPGPTIGLVDTFA